MITWLSSMDRVIATLIDGAVRRSRDHAVPRSRDRDVNRSRVHHDVINFVIATLLLNAMLINRILWLITIIPVGVHCSVKSLRCWYHENPSAFTVRAQWKIPSWVVRRFHRFFSRGKFIAGYTFSPSEFYESLSRPFIVGIEFEKVSTTVQSRIIGDHPISTLELLTDPWSVEISRDFGALCCLLFCWLMYMLLNIFWRPQQYQSNRWWNSSVVPPSRAVVRSKYQRGFSPAHRMSPDISLKT